MIMDHHKPRAYTGAMSGIKVNNNNQICPAYLDPNLIRNLRVTDNLSNNVAPFSDRSNLTAQAQLPDSNHHEDLDFSDVVLKYINHILMEEDVEDKACMFQESAALQAAEKSFYDVIGEKYPVSKINDHNKNNKQFSNLYQTPSETLCPDWNSQPSHNSCSSSGTVTDYLIDSPVSTLKIPDMLNAIQIKKGVEEASKLLPRGKKNPYPESSSFLMEDEKRSNKQCAVYTESTVSPDMFDEVLLCSGGKNDLAIRKALSEVTKINGGPQNVQAQEMNGKKKRGKRNVVDMRTLLTLCAQSVAADDRRAATEFLKQIRQHASPTGDGMQRLAYYFADGLEARMAGSGTQIYKSFLNMYTSAADFLKAYHIYLATCPFRKISNFFSNRTFMKVADNENVMTLHIVDFGILYGFQWPCFIQRLSTRPGGPPKLRVTGIDYPCPGFRPSERVEETGRRLARYAETFNVPFEFNAIAQKWETIKIEDLKIEKDEMLVVNCLFRLRNLLDETVIINSPRNIVLNLIRNMNPVVFVMGIMNGAYNAPFFITRFREALFHYSSFFDMLDANIPREIHERMLLERTVFGREAMNVIACEGAERIERPESYKQWQVRNMRVGLEQLPLDGEMMRIARNRVKLSYHKDFVIDEDGHWLLQGWKGRIVYAISSWRPAY